jgi:hypothetical protein
VQGYSTAKEDTEKLKAIVYWKMEEGAKEIQKVYAPALKGAEAPATLHATNNAALR